MIKLELVDDVTELSVKVSSKSSKLGNLQGSKVTNQGRLFKVMVEGGKVDMILSPKYLFLL